MFTGLVDALGTVRTVVPVEGGRRLTVEAPYAADLEIGESVAVDGCCLTVVAVGDGAFVAEAVAETLRKTTLGALAAGARVNLERALLPTTRLGGHIVLGHVDAVGEVVSVTEDGGGSRLVTVAYPPSFAPYLIPVGSVAVSGVSLTVARLDAPAAGTFTVAIIPHTWAATTLGEAVPGLPVNLEFDVVGKYALRQRGLDGADNAVRA